ncbi:hypothetical protein [Oceanobacillus senegalensis]|uniref:hypothetical protein n=1 Tax=Oceanobacillus senegalensis TaxID=1936063 RepID=UPI000A30A61F|nr:hypothetical protein [Oceanobacillus senegalensis]
MKLRNKWFLFLSVVMSVLLLAACSGDGEEQSAPAEDDAAQTEEGQEAETEEEDSQEPANSLSSDDDLQTQLEAEEGIESAMVQVVDGEQNAVNVDLEIAADQDPEAAFEKYGEMIKEAYPDRTIDLIIVQDGQMVKQDQL